jgi:hypothetical protein
MTTATTPVKSVQTIGTGQVEKDHKSLFRFESFACKKQHSTVTTEEGSDNESSSEGDAVVSSEVEEMVFDTSTDLAYHDAQEYKDCKAIVKSLTKEEMQVQYLRVYVF